MLSALCVDLVIEAPLKLPVPCPLCCHPYKYLHCYIQRDRVFGSVLNILLLTAKSHAESIANTLQFGGRGGIPTMTTRAAVKQQKDDHMATLIAMLGKQRERQEELAAARHQSRLEQLKTCSNNDGTFWRRDKAAPKSKFTWSEVTCRQ